MKHYIFIGVVIALVGTQSAFADTPIVAQTGDDVRYNYTLRIDGKVVETTDEGLAEANHINSSYERDSTIGSGETSIEKKIENSLLGMSVGGTKTFTIAAQDAYSTGMIEQTEKLPGLMKHSEITITREEASPYFTREYDLSDFSRIIQRRMKVWLRVASPYYSEDRGVVKSLSGETVVIQFVDTTHPFYNKNIKVGLSIKVGGDIRFTIKKIHNDGSMQLAVYNPDAPLDTLPTVGQRVEYDGGVIITGIDGERFKYVPVDNLIGKALDYTIALTRIDRTTKTDTTITNTTSRLRESDE